MFALNLLLGACIGSFIGVCALRRGKESIVFPPSHCDTCESPLKPLDLLPIFSYLFLKGRCRYCGTRIPLTLFVVECVGAVIFCLLYVDFGLTLNYFLSVSLLSILLYMALVDFLTLEVDDGALWSVFLLSIVIIFRQQTWSFDRLIGIILWLIFCYLVRESMGDGDKYLIAIFLLLFEPLQQLWFFFYSIWSAGIVAVVLLLRGAGRKTQLAFIPFIFVGLFISILRGGLL